MKEKLLQHILKFIPISEKEWNEFSSLLTTKHLKSKEYLLKEGNTNQHLSFVTQGCFRMYMIHKNGAEKTINFAVEDWWLADFDSLLNQRPSQLYIQAIERSEILQISKEDLDTLFKRSLVINQYFRIIHEKVRVADQRRIQYFFNLTGKELYDTFCAFNPEFVNRIPQYMLASYLGFTPEFLSKIRAER